MRTLSALSLSLVLAAACGGDPKPAVSPDPVASAAPAPTDSAPAASSTAASSDSAAPPASAAPTTTTPPAPPPPTPIAVAPLKIAGSKSTKGKAIEVKADGSVMVAGKPMAKFVGAELQDNDGKTIFAVAADGTVTGPSVNRSSKVSGADEIVGDDGSKLTVADDGTVTFTNASGKADKAPFKITGVGATSRRAAVLLVAWITMPSGPPTVTTSGPATAPPAAPPKPKTK